MSRTLVIGGRSGIGEALVSSLWDQSLEDDNIVAPTQETFDVTRDALIWPFLDRHAPFDEVVFCAGIQRIEPLGDMSEAATEIIEVNLVGFLRVVNALAHFQKGHRTSIVAVVSDASRTAMRGSIAYCASKAGLAHAVRCAAREMAPLWRVNGVSPAVVADTPMTAYIDSTVPKIRGWTSEEAEKYERSMIPMGRRASKHEVVDLICNVLRGPEFLTGSIVEMTGGK